jgi:hypothetical protein
MGKRSNIGGNTSETYIQKQIIIFATIVLSIIVFASLCKIFVKRIGIQKTTFEPMKAFEAPYLSQGASSVDSENQFADTGEQWRGQSNKCYTCEKQMKEMCGDQCVFKQATKTKCFDC